MDILFNILIAFSTLAVLGVAVWRLFRDHDLKSVFVALFALIYAVVILMGQARFMGFLPAVNDTQTAHELSHIQSYLPGMLFIMLTGLIVVVNILFGMSIVKRISLLYIIIVIVVGFVVIGCLLSFFSNKTTLDTLFGTCCSFMAAVGFSLGLTYREFCVIGNNLLQPLLVVISALVVCIEAWRIVKEDHSFISWLNGLLSTLILGAYSWILLIACSKYLLPINAAFDNTVHDLSHVAKLWHTSYVNVNIFIYIIGFVAAIALNLLARWLLRRELSEWTAFIVMVLHLFALAAIFVYWPL